MDKIRFLYKKTSKKRSLIILAWSLLCLLLIAIDSLLLVSSWVHFVVSLVFFLVFIAIMLFFRYKIRLFPEFIKFEGDKVKISYLNKRAFRVKTFTGNACDCKMKSENEDYVIVNGEQIVAYIKTCELDEDELAFLKEKFKSNE